MMDTARVRIGKVHFKASNITALPGASEPWKGASTHPLLEILERLRAGKGAYDYIAIYEVDDERGRPEIHYAVNVDAAHSITYMGALHRIMHMLNTARDDASDVEYNGNGGGV